MRKQPPRNWVVLRRISQGVFLLLFVVSAGWLSNDIFYETDPNLMLFTAVAAWGLLHEIAPALVMLGLTLILGRFFCGWICPLGTLIDAAGTLRRRRNGLSESGNRLARNIRLVIWIAILATALAGLQVAWHPDPMVIAGRFVSLNLIPAVSTVLGWLIGAVAGIPVIGGFLRDLWQSFPGGDRTYGTAASLGMFAVFLFTILLSLWLPRLWCRSQCPLGALYALTGRLSPLGRRTSGCTSCRACTKLCRMGAIRNDGEYEKGECILCMDCVYDCKIGKTWFSFRAPGKKRPPEAEGRGVTRAQFLALAGAPILAAMLRGRRAFAAGALPAPAAGPLRPPGAVPGDAFSNQCVRCGNCMSACPTNVIQPLIGGAGIESLWSPAMAYDVAWCSYNCNKCGEVCPTNAISDLTLAEKQRFRIGLAVVNRTTCYPWSTSENCLVCEEQCPIPTKAIKVVEARGKGGVILRRPVVDPKLCIGCGSCQNKCPQTPAKAIIVGPVK